ncbi:hypothetical protein ACN08X_04765 [Rothia sp. P6271]|uniref:hypothetical protein n=1 Tax=unclassified Rothia (in: high G+C Gram-positive bacteria) TaxID=2689056 RepID=UPI003AD1A04C
MNSSSRGNTIVARKALVTVCTAVASEAFGVASSDIKTTLTDHSGKLGVNISIPLRAPRLDEIPTSPDFLQEMGGTVFDLVERARALVIAQASEITGREIGAVNVSISGITEYGKQVRVQ